MNKRSKRYTVEKEILMILPI